MKKHIEMYYMVQYYSDKTIKKLEKLQFRIKKISKSYCIIFLEKLYLHKLKM